MKAIQTHQYGASEVLKLEEIPKPVCGENEILIKVHAAGVNPIDWKVRAGLFSEVFIYDLPLILGWDMAGTVEALGSKVEAFKHGDGVFGLIDFPNAGKCYAEYVTVRPEHIWHKPAQFSFVEAAACPLVTLTAWQILFEVGKLTASQKVLIHAGAGGVGHVAIQLAKAKGAQVYTTCSNSKQEFVSSLGADHIIDYQQDSFQNEMNDIDLVIDTVGGEITKQSISVLKKNGILVSIASQMTPDIEQLAKDKEITAVWHIVHPSQTQLREIASLADEGLLKMHVSQSYPFKEVIKAHQDIESGHTKGKTVLTF